MFDLSPARLILGVIFGAAGFVSFVYGKKTNSWKPMVAGLSLMGLPYLLQEPVALCATGLLILAALYIFRD